MRDALKDVTSTGFDQSLCHFLFHDVISIPTNFEPAEKRDNVVVKARELVQGTKEMKLGSGQLSWHVACEAPHASFLLMQF